MRDLTITETAVLIDAAQGSTADQTAKRLDRKTSTVKLHRRQVIAKLGATNMTHAVARGYELGILGAKPTVELISDGQMRAFYAKCSAIDKLHESPRGTTARKTLAAVAEACDRSIEDARDLTAREAHDALDQLEAESLRGVA